MSRTPAGWNKKSDKLTAIFKCKDFKHALALLNSIGNIAESLNHHPDLGIRNYNEVLISTTTHSLNKLTIKDYKLAEEISDLINYEKKKQQIETFGRS